MIYFKGQTSASIFRSLKKCNQAWQLGRLDTVFGYVYNLARASRLAFLLLPIISDLYSGVLSRLLFKNIGWYDDDCFFKVSAIKVKFFLKTLPRPCPHISSEIHWISWEGRHLLPVCERPLYSKQEQLIDQPNHQCNDNNCKSQIWAMWLWSC